MKVFKHFRYKYLTLVALGLALAAFLAGNELFQKFLLNLGSLEYLGAFLAGILFVSSFTIPISTVVIVVLSQDINPLLLALVGGVGAMIGDLIIFNFVKDDLGSEIAQLLGKHNTTHIKAVLYSKYIAWMLPIVGGLIIASPLPDELGVGLLGLAHISKLKFMLVSYFFNSVGILMVASLASAF